MKRHIVSRLPPGETETGKVTDDGYAKAQAAKLPVPVFDISQKDCSDLRTCSQTAAGQPMNYEVPAYES